MTMRLIRTGSYLAGLDQIDEYIGRESPRAALALWDAIEARIESLLDHPHLGRPGRIEGTRELVVSGTPYVVGYRVIGDEIQVLRVLHGARQWPQDLTG
jgi:toxin ParE1/3/4